MIGTPYIALAALLALLGAFTAGNLHGARAEKAAWMAVQAQERAEAAEVAAKAQTAVTEALFRVDEANRIIEVRHAEDLAANDAARDDFARRLRLAQARSRSCGAVPAAANDPGHGADASTGSEPGPSGAFVAGSRLRDAGLKLQAYARACNAWAVSVGR